MVDIKRIIYILKRRNGSPIDIYVEGDEIFNPLTGKSIKSRIKYSIKQAVVLPSSSEYNNPLITAVAKLSGTMITASRNILIDAKDIPVIPEEGNYIDYKDSRYEVMKVSIYENKRKILGYLLTIREAKKELPYFITDEFFNDTLVMAQLFKNYPPIFLEIDDTLELSDEYL